MAYLHSSKAGNIGDVWKHFALARIFKSLTSRKDIYYLETHSGGGVYALDPKKRGAEWGKGIAKVVGKFGKEPFFKVFRQVNSQRL